MLALGFKRLERRYVEKWLRILAGLQARDNAIEIFAEQERIKHVPIVGGASRTATGPPMIEN
ncbi:hypothetical protein [Ottowia sp. SB7-C50]|uniref:hypothetical protein n=1 Tax=Ottowia sp. SB7-C50 TaxID=3081231 RepID=UPI002953DDC5|nr:hypothetical protein [Ottowia sp. SB7-C50]WOP17194.1 hypothetical protein R0D99_13580 [Ottowia sp. SB7-C50]